jgi:hypothetical protein
MAISKAFDLNSQVIPPFDASDIKFGVKDYAIGGKMVDAAYVVSYVDVMAWKTNFEDYVKEQLAQQMARYMLNNKLIEFTKKSSPHSDVITYRARCYLTPDDKVKILRVHER